MTDDEREGLRALATARVSQYEQYERHRPGQGEPLDVTFARGVLSLLDRLAADKRERDEIVRCVQSRTSHPSHQMNGTILNQCVRCETFQGQPDSFLPCDPSKTAGKVEYCCECGEPYPRSDLIAGHIFCPVCRTPEVPRVGEK